MTLLRPAPVSTGRFLYHAASNTFTAEASDLPVMWTGRAYDDACDEGLTLVSTRTGAEVVCVLHDMATSEGDVLFWTFRPADPAHTFVVNVFND
jgi:hypothetical protein